MSRHFISYSSVDARAFALRLRDALETGSPPIHVWFDRRDIRPGREWDEEIVEALKTCVSFLFVMTRDSVEDGSVCKKELARALKYKKPVVPLKLHADADAPFRLDSLQHIDFTRALDSDEQFNATVAHLREHLAWLASPDGVLRTLEDCLADAERELRRATDPAGQERIRDEIEQLLKEIAGHEAVNDAPAEPVAVPPVAKKSDERPDTLVNVILMIAFVIIALVYGRPRSTTPDLVDISEKSFQMGSLAGHDNEKPVHTVTFPKTLYIGRHEVTQAEWLARMDNNPSEEKGDALPVTNVSWAEAKDYIDKLNQQQDGYIYHIPSEAEWEHACRVKPSDAKHRLFGMNDGAWEWCADLYHQDYDHAPENGQPWESDGEDRLRMMRGGACEGDADKCRCSFRNWGLVSDISPKNAGLRVAAELDTSFPR